MLSADIATMWDSSAHNAGFVVAKPTSFGRSVYERMKHLTSRSPTLDDQSAMNAAISAMNKAKTTKAHRFSAVKLDTNK